MVLRLRRPPPSWVTAKCFEQAAGPDDDPWFDNSELGFEDETSLGLEVCNGTNDGVVCPLREVCLLFALVNNEKSGIWGGLSETDRRITRKLYPWDPKNPAEPHAEWRWRDHADLIAQYRARFSAAPLPEPEEEDDDDPDED